jgi:hypothetical protein
MMKNMLLNLLKMKYSELMKKNWKTHHENKKIRSFDQELVW